MGLRMVGKTYLSPLALLSAAAAAAATSPAPSRQQLGKRRGGCCRRSCRRGPHHLLACVLRTAGAATQAHGGQGAQQGVADDGSDVHKAQVQVKHQLIGCQLSPAVTQVHHRIKRHRLQRPLEGFATELAPQRQRLRGRGGGESAELSLPFLAQAERMRAGSAAA